MPKIEQPRPASSTIYLGVDPGKLGGIARIDGSTASAYKMESSYFDLYHLVEGLADASKVFCVIEKVHAMPSQGVTSMFTFGKGFGALLMTLTALTIPHEEVDPRRWQKALAIPPRKKTETKPQFKKRLRVFAQKLFPRATGLTQDTADSLLIAEFARRYREGLLT